MAGGTPLHHHTAIHVDDIRLDLLLVFIAATSLLWLTTILLAVRTVQAGVAGGPGDATDDCSLLEPEVQDALRKELAQNNCIRELEVRLPTDGPRILWPSFFSINLPVLLRPFASHPSQKFASVNCQGSRPFTDFELLTCNLFF